MTKGMIVADEQQTRPSATTRETERADAEVHAAADDMPTADEEAAAERAGRPDPAVERNYEDAIERGADQQGEGRIP